jgi:hypothetical protein
MRGSFVSSAISFASKASMPGGLVTFYTPRLDRAEDAPG